ncbi:tRNA wybutosine-synthesizing protein 3 [Sarotherodon galilaeus]
MPPLSSSSSPPPLCRRIILGADGHLPARLPLSSCGFFGNPELRIGTPPFLSPLRAHPGRLRDSRGGRCHAWMRRWVDERLSCLTLGAQRVTNTPKTSGTPPTPQPRKHQQETPQYLTTVGREGRGTKSFIRALIYQVLQVFKVSHTLLTSDIPNRPSSGPNMKPQTQQCRNVPVCQTVLLLMVSCQNIKGPQVFIEASHGMQDAAQQVNPLTHTHTHTTFANTHHTGACVRAVRIFLPVRTAGQARHTRTNAFRCTSSFVLQCVPLSYFVFIPAVTVGVEHLYNDIKGLFYSILSSLFLFFSKVQSAMPDP